MRVVLKPGEQVTISLQDTDGEFVVKFGKNRLTVTVDMPDAEGRAGLIYEELYGKHTSWDN